MAKRKLSGKKYQLFDDKNFVLIAGGGFIVLVLMFMVSGNMGMLNRVKKSEVSASQTIERFVTIENSTVMPKVVRITKGTTITWTNKDQVLHAIAGDDGSFNTGNLYQGESGSVTFGKIGTFEYKDKYSPEIQGTIMVE